MYILQYQNYPTDIPKIKYFHKYTIEHVSMQVTTTTLSYTDG
jgi:hypothetical protein